jgi:ureidoglycolate lyase
MEIQLQPLTAAAFAPFGLVIDAQAAAPGSGRPINHGSSVRLDMPGLLDVQRQAGHAAVALFRAQPRAVRGPWQELERHRLCSQTFIPLAGARCVVLVALGTESPDPRSLAAFDMQGHQGCTLHAGTWHHGLIARDTGDFVVIERAAPVQADGSRAVDCDIALLPEPVTLVARGG